MTLKIAQLGEPVLREKAREVTTEEIVSPEFQALLRDMEETMTASSGVGLAAPQVFDGRRVFREQKASHFRSLAGMSCPGHDYPRILEGEAHFSAYSRNMPWDHLPGVMLLAEAGWTYAKLDRSPYRVSDTTGGVMSAPRAADWDAIWTIFSA